MATVIVVIAAYIAAQMLADVTSLRIVTVMGLSMDAGTLVYPFTFTLRDLVHKTIGARGARVLIVTAAVVNVAMAGLFWLTAWLPADQTVGPQASFGSVLAPVWRIVFASIVAEVLSELLDTEVYRLWVRHVTRRYQWARVLTSNALSIPLDSLVFCVLAFSDSGVMWALFASNVIIKGAVTLLSLPTIYMVKDGSDILR